MMTDNLQEILNCLKKSGVDDPNVDLFLGTITDDINLVKKAIGKGADVNLKDKQLVAKYRNVLQNNCPEILKKWDKV